MANETVELYYKGKPINPNRDLPTRTYAEAQAEGLTSSDKLWVRKDGDGTVITADQVPYDSNNSVKDKLDWNLIGTLTGQSGNSINLTGYTEYIFIPKVNGVFRYNSYHTLKMAIWYGSTGIFHMSCYENSSTGWHGHVEIASDGTATLTNDLLTSWSSMTVDVYGKK